MAMSETIRESMNLQVASAYHERGGSRVASDHEVFTTLETHKYLTNGVMFIDIFL